MTDVFKVDWNTYMASRKNVIVAQIDGRGSGGQGHQLLHEVYMKLGSVEVADQLEVTEYNSFQLNVFHYNFCYLVIIY